MEAGAGAVVGHNAAGALYRLDVRLRGSLRGLA